MIDVRLEGVQAVYPGGVVALDGVSLHLRPGEQAALMGGNGSGKSTLARHLVGLLRPTAGRVLLDGHDAARQPVARLARRVGVLLQDAERHVAASSVEGEVANGPRLRGLRGPALRAAVARALEAVGLTDHAATHPHDLERARRRLVALAAVLALDTPLVVLDEPTAGQDLAGLETVIRVLARLRTEGRTVLAISHDAALAAEHFERVVVLRTGRVALDGPPDSVFAPAAWQTLEAAGLEPPLAARLGQRLGLGSTPSASSLLAALARQAPG